MLFLYNSHFSELLRIYYILPSVDSLMSVPQHPAAATFVAKTLVMGKTGIFIVDTFYLHIMMLMLVIIFVVLRVARNNCSLYGRVNPYLLTYSFRLLFMELLFSAILFFTYIELTETIMRVSLALLVIDLVAVAASFFWKVRTDL